MTVTNPEPNPGERVYSAKCKCGCKFQFERQEARIMTHPAKLFIINCPECLAEITHDPDKVRDRSTRALF